MLFGGAAIAAVLIVLSIGMLQSLGETRLTWIFPIISVVALTWFLARCMFGGATHQ